MSQRYERAEGGDATVAVWSPDGAEARWGGAGITGRNLRLVRRLSSRYPSSHREVLLKNRSKLLITILVAPSAKTSV